MANVGVDWKPQLYPNEPVDAKEVEFPVLASYKMDGIRCVFRKGQMLSRSLKQIPNEQLQDGPLAYLKCFSKEKHVTFDGELYSPSMTFGEITSIVMAKDKPVPSDLRYYCFDYLIEAPEGQVVMNRDARTRYLNTMYMMTEIPARVPIIMVHKSTLTRPEHVTEMYLEALELGYEGLILQNPASLYKCGRITVKSGDGCKFKPFLSFDAQVTGVSQATVVDPSVPTTTNELGRTVTSKKKDDRVLIPMAASVNVDYQGKVQKVSLSLTDEECKEIWANKEAYIGRWIEYRAMMVGAKDVPRHPTSVRWRPDLDQVKA